MSSGKRYHYEAGLVVAEAIKELISPYCERVEIAGSVRRKKPDVGDVEIVCIPQIIRRQQNLFGGESGPIVTPVYDAIRKEEWIQPRSFEGRPQAMGKRYQALYDTCIGIHIDVFFVLPPAQWGVIMTLRTGSADFNVRMMQTARRRNLRCEDGRLINTGSRGGIVSTPTEESFFEAVGVQWVPPEQRG